MQFTLCATNYAVIAGNFAVLVFMQFMLCKAVLFMKFLQMQIGCMNCFAILAKIAQICLNHSV